VSARRGPARRAGAEPGASGGFTSFGRRVLTIVRKIPPGRVTTYGDLARLAGRPRAARAVGTIMRTAAVPGLPYHRVIAAGGRLGGYGGSESLKEALLRQEGVPVTRGRIRGFAARRWPEPD
jgi:methylated-DNA-[protein]-cysteine S-methyltransferase